MYVTYTYFMYSPFLNVHCMYTTKEKELKFYGLI